MNKQEVFNQVVQHLLKQNEKSMNESGDCAYHNPNGLKCAIGCLITDDLYNTSIEGTGIYSISKNGSYLDHLSIDGNQNDYSFLDSLRTVHDCFPVEEWPQQLRAVAIGNSLDLPKELQNEQA